jgi:Phosphotransferase enzyme family
MDEILLNSGVNEVVRVGNTVRRNSGPWTSSVHALLKHLRERNFLSAPEVLGFDNKGREILSYIAGEVGTYILTPAARSDTALISAAKLLRAYHDATVDFVSSYHGVWQLEEKEPVEVICHGDFAPYNCVFKNDKVIGMLDFDMAHPGSRIWDVAYSAYRFAPLSASGNQESFGTFDEKVKRTILFCDTYGLKNKEKLITILLERISSLLNFLYKNAKSGNKVYQQYVAEGYDKIYLKDLEYIKNNEEAFTKKII